MWHVYDGIVGDKGPDPAGCLPRAPKPMLSPIDLTMALHRQKEPLRWSSLQDRLKVVCDDLGNEVIVSHCD